MNKAQKFLKRFNEAAGVNENLPREIANQANKTQLGAVMSVLSKRGIDIQNTDFSLEKIESPRDSRLNDPENIFIFTMNNNDVFLVKDKRQLIATWTKEKWFSGSWKNIFANVKSIYLVPKDFASNTDLTASRSKARAGAVGLYRHEKKQKSYISPYSGDKMYNTSRGYDKSGYAIDTNKYRRKLSEIRSNKGFAAVSEALDALDNYNAAVRKGISDGLSVDSIRKATSIAAALNTRIGYAFGYQDRFNKEKSGETTKFTLDYYKDSLDSEIAEIVGLTKELNAVF